MVCFGTDLWLARYRFTVDQVQIYGAVKTYQHAAGMVTICTLFQSLTKKVLNSLLTD